jgi:hypothetical protein
MMVSVGACSPTEAIPNITRVTGSARGLVCVAVSADMGITSLREGQRVGRVVWE